MEFGFGRVSPRSRCSSLTPRVAVRFFLPTAAAAAAAAAAAVGEEWRMHFCRGERSPSPSSLSVFETSTFGDSAPPSFPPSSRYSVSRRRL